MTGANAERVCELCEGRVPECCGHPGISAGANNNRRFAEEDKTRVLLRDMNDSLPHRTFCFVVPDAKTYYPCHGTKDEAQGRIQTPHPLVLVFPTYIRLTTPLPLAITLAFPRPFLLRVFSDGGETDSGSGTR